MERNQIVANGLLTRSDLDRLGQQFSRIFPLEDIDHFEDLLDAIDHADAIRAKGTGHLDYPK